MESTRRKFYRGNKKTVVSLTSLLDLLFVMIFVSLIQQKTITENVKPIKKIGKNNIYKNKSKTQENYKKPHTTCLKIIYS